MASTDSNDIVFHPNLGFFNILKKDLNYYTIEVYNKSFMELKSKENY